MRILRALLVVLVTANVLGWGLPAAVVSGAAPGKSLAAPAAGSATIQVTVEGDQNDDSGNPASASSGCSLREALQLTFSDGNQGCGATINGATNITIKMPPGDFVLTIPDDLPPIADGRVINISGPGVVIDGGGQSRSLNGIFHVVDGTLNLKNMTLQHGSRPGGGAVWLGVGAVTADNVRFDSNSAAISKDFVGTGGAILDDSGDVTVTNSIFVNNLAFYSGGAVAANSGYFFNDQFIGNRASDGGAFSLSAPNSSPLVISQSQFKGNLAQPQPVLAPTAGYKPNGDLYGGGAIHNKGTLSITKTLFQNNQTVLAKGGGALWNQGQAVMNECVFTQNTAIAQGPVITSTWGGAIINYGDLQLVRCSIHHNQADYAGAIFNHGTANLQIFNSTISENSATQSIGGIMNEHSLFDSAVGPGAQVHLTHVTIGMNAPSVRVVDALWDRSVWFSNSIINGSCSGIQYTVGHSVMAGICDTEQDPNTVPQGGADISATTQPPLHLQALSEGNSTVPEFMVQKIDSHSNAVGVGRDDQYGCGNAAINHRDQNLAPRQVPCDAGAYQAGGAAPRLKSTPAPSLIDFPLIDLSLGQSGSLANLVLKNIGNGALTYQIEDGGGSSAIVNDSGSTDQVTLFENQQSTISFSCNASSPGQYWHEITVETDAPNQAQVDYQLRCDVVGDMGLPAMMQMPGPYNMPMPLPGQTAHSGFDISNPGHMPVAFQPTLMMMGPPWMTTVTAVGQAPNHPATTLNPGQSAHVDVACTPTAPGVYLNTLTFTTNDPDNPTIQYNLSCEGQVPSPPEPLHTASASTPSPLAHPYGVAVSPDGAQVLAGGGLGEATLSAFVRDPSTGALTQNGNVALPPMTAIQSIQYSHDGQYVYYTSAEGNGLVAIALGPGDSLGASQVITSGTPDNICYISHFPVFCPNNVMHGADGLAVSPDDQFVYVVGYYDNSLTTFQRQPNGQLDLYQIITGTVNGLSGPVKVVASPDGNNVYVASFNSSTVAAFQRTGEGVLAFQAAYQNGIGGLANLGAPSDLAVSPDGNFVYIAASTSNAVDVFQRDSAAGGLSLSSVITGVTGVWGLAITPDAAGRRLFLTTQSTTNQVQVYGRDQTTGALSFVDANTVTDPVFVTSSPDGLDVYASLYSVPALQHFQTVRNAPVLSHISPASALMGSGTFTLTAGGGRFYPDSQIVWNGAPLATVFVSEHELQAAVPAGLVAAQGTPPVKVRNPAPGGGDSTPQPFAITTPAQPPVPSIASLDPPAASFGGGDLVVLVHGANFAADAQVYYNHTSVPTIFIDSQTLQITLSADILNTPGDGGLEVTNGGATPALNAPAAATASNSSTVVSFRVNRPGVPAAPALASLSPASVVSGSAPIWVTVTGYNFSAGAPAQSVGQWNGSVRPSVVIDAHTLLMGLTRADLAKAGYGQVTVQTPGYGTSTPLAFRVRLPNEKPIPVVTGDGLNGWTLFVRGSDFVSGAQVYVNGSARATTFINQYELKTTVTPADKGVLIRVVNPGPGGGPSNYLITLLVHLLLPLIRR